MSSRATLEFTISCRLLPGASRADLLPELKAFLTPLVPDTSTLRVAFNDDLLSWAPGMDLGAADPLARIALHAVRDAGYQDAQFGGFPGFSEGTFLARAGVPTLPGLGPGALIHCHLPDERVSVRGLYASVQIYEALIQEVFRPGSEVGSVQPRLTASSYGDRSVASRSEGRTAVRSSAMACRAGQREDFALDSQ